MAKNKNENNDAGDYLAQIEQDNRKIQSHTGLPWYKGANRIQSSYSRKNSLLVKSLLILAYVIMGLIFYMAHTSALILWLVFGAVFLLMLRDANRKPKDND